MTDTAAAQPDVALADRLAALRDRVAAACAAAGRNESEVTIIAVTKTVDAGRVRAALQAGLTEFGENRVPEAQDKIAAVGGGRWHLVGRLQRNKARPACQLFSVVHSLDSVRLARRLETVRGDRSPAVLIQVNLTGLATQGGIAPDAAGPLVELVTHETSLHLSGLMTIGPQGAGEAEVRRVFARLRDLRDALQTECPAARLPELSMGMTDDFEAAIVEGATMIRVGRAIFGTRPEPGQT